MENFEFYNPTRIIFGKEAEKKIGKILEKDDVERVLFVYGKSSIKETGLYDRIVKALKKKELSL